MTNLKTKPSLLAALKEAASHEPSAKELKEQRISFIMGTLKRDSAVTRAKVIEVLEAHGGKK